MTTPSVTPRLLKLRDFADRLPWSLGHCRNLLSENRFPIARVEGPWLLFSEADVTAFVEQKQITNPALLGPKPSRYFQSARRQSLKRRSA